MFATNYNRSEQILKSYDNEDVRSVSVRTSLPSKILTSLIFSTAVLTFETNNTTAKSFKEREQHT